MKILRQMLWNIANFASTNKNYDVHSSVLVLPWCVQLVGTTLTSAISQNIHIVTTPCRKVPKFHSDSPIHACINYRLYSLSLHCHMNKHFTVTTGCRCCPHLSLQIRVSPFRQEELNYILLAIRACNPQGCLTTLQ